MKSLVVLLFCLNLLFPVLSLAELPEQVKLDYAVLQGYILMPINDEFVVDLAASDHLNVGDILTLVTPGANIFHPVTKEMVGSVAIPAGYLQVTRIQSGYSYAKLLSAEVAPKNGAEVRRFEQVPVLFIDEKGGDGALSRQLKMDLPQLKWLKEGDNEHPLLTFTRKADTLVVKTVDDNLLHSYSVTGSQQLAAPLAQVRRPFIEQKAQPEPMLLQKVANSLLGTLNLKEENDFNVAEAGIIRQKSAGLRGVWLGPNMSGNPVGIVVADLDGDGLQETAVAFDNKLLIGRVSQGQYTEIAEIAAPSGRQNLSLDAVDLDQDGRPELCLSAVSGLQTVSFVVQYTVEGKYAPVIENIDWYLRVVDLPGQQRALIGQEVGRDKQSFEGKPFHLRLEKNRLVKDKSIDLPGLVNIYSFVTFVDKENRLLYAYLTEGDYLKVINAEGTDLWESSEHFGGSEACFVNRIEHVGDLVVPTCIRSRLVKTPDNEILVAQNDGQRLMQRYHKFKESRIVSLSWNGFSMVENWRTVSQKGYLGDFALADGDNDGSLELVMAVKFKHKGLIDDARSAIVNYKLD